MFQSLPSLCEEAWLQVSHGHICGEGFHFILCVKERCCKHLSAGEWHGQPCGFRKISVTDVKKMMGAPAWKEALVGGARVLRLQRLRWRQGRWEFTGFPGTVEPRKRHCHYLFLMRNAVHIRDQRGNNQTLMHFTREEKVRKRVGWAGRKSWNCADPACISRPPSLPPSNCFILRASLQICLA